jgi:hypothetical protein
VKNELKVSLNEALQIVDIVHKDLEPNFHPVILSDGCVSKILRIIGFVFLAVAFLCFCIAGIVYSIQCDTVEKGEKVTGTVTGFKYADDGGAAPTIEYEFDGQHKVFQSHIFSTPPSFAADDKVILYINKEKPDHIVVESFSERWLGIIVFAAAGMFFAILMIIFLFVSRKF